MKNCDEMVKSLLERRERYVKEQRAKRRIAISTAIPAFSICAVFLGVGIWYGGTFGVATSDNNGTFPQNSAETSNTQSADAPYNELIDVIGTVKVDGINYIQCNNVGKIYTPDVCLGNASDYEGTYQTFFRDSADKLYTVKEDSDILMVKLENGDYVILTREKN